MITIHNYHIHRKRGYLVAVNHEEPLCPVCNSSMKVKDSYKRKVKDANGQEYVFRTSRSIQGRRLYRNNHVQYPVSARVKSYTRETQKGLL